MFSFWLALRQVHTSSPIHPVSHQDIPSTLLARHETEQIAHPQSCSTLSLCKWFSRCEYADAAIYRPFLCRRLCLLHPHTWAQDEIRTRATRRHRFSHAPFVAKRNDRLC